MLYFIKNALAFTGDKKKIKGTHFPCFYANLHTCLSFCLYHMTSMVFSCTINDSVICVQSAKSLKGN